MSVKIKEHYDMKTIFKLALLIIPLTLFACDKNNLKEDLYNSVNNAKCINEYPKDTMPSSFDTVKLGKYEQDNNLNNGKEDVEWFVLKKDGGKALLLSKYIIDLKQFDELIDIKGEIIEEKRDEYSTLTSWKNSLVRDWLNGEFYNNTFNDKEKELICESEINYSMEFKSPYSNGAFVNMYGNEKVNDKIFLLSSDDINLYIGRSAGNLNKKLIAEASEYVKNEFDKKYRSEYQKNLGFNDEELEGEKLKNYFVTNCFTYMLRDVDMVNYYNLVKCIDENGYIPKHGKNFELTYSQDMYMYGIKKFNKSDTDSFVSGIRPAMWIDLGEKVFKVNEFIDNRIGSGTGVKYNIKDINKMHSIVEYSIDTDVNDFDTVSFGKWEQDANFENGTEDIEWILLEKNDKEAKLISKYVIDYGYQMQFNTLYSFSSEEEKCVKEVINDIKTGYINSCETISNDEILAYDDVITNADNVRTYLTKKFKTSYTKYAEYLMGFYNAKYRHDGYWLRDEIKDGGYLGGTNVSRATDRSRVSGDGFVNYNGTTYWCWGGYYNDDYCLGTDRYVCGFRPVIYVLLDSIDSFDIYAKATYRYRDFEYGNEYTIDNIYTSHPMWNEKEGLTYDYIDDLAYEGSVKLKVQDGCCINDKYFNKGSVRDMFDTIKFGKYEQDNNLENGPEDIEWIIVQIKNDKKSVTLMSKYILDYMEYQHDDIEDKTWETSDIRKFLNGDFYDEAFNEEEKARVVLVKHDLIENYETKSVYEKVSIPYTLYGSNSTDATNYTDFAQDKFLNDESSLYPKNLKENRADYFLMYGNYYIDGYESCYSESNNNFKSGVRPVIIIHYNDK